MDLVKDAIETPYGANLCNSAQNELKKTFQLEGNHFQDNVHLNPDKRTKGERCYKGVFYPRKHELSIYKVEVQIQTQLQEAWDKKDHFLIYEPRRRGESVDDSRVIEMFSMSELLYIADLTFDRLRKTIIEERQ